MKARIKWLLVGLGFTFGLQILISLIFIAIAYTAKSSEAGVQEGPILLVLFGLTIGAFLIGGLVVGWMNDRPRLLDALAVAIITLLLNWLILWRLPDANKGQFVAASWLSEANTPQAVLFVALALIATVAGAHIGGYFTVPTEGVLDRVLLLLGLVGAVVLPFVMLAVGGRDPSRPDQPNLPWYFLVIVLLLVLGIIGVGFYWFTHESHDPDEISISPEHHKEG
ncbi:MAG TPA: hypothetical protein VJH03_21540 [Blastocatellia bacterium]|nr:hypothetical protein [Blastocatellia bacterium]